MARPLPPLNSIRAFEIAARHLNFSRAAEEAGVTQGAISKQILLLEDYIGSKLFERLPGGLALTDEGRMLRLSVAPAFQLLEQSFERYSRRSPRSNVCRLSTLGSFAAEFLVPRLDDFERDCPHISLEILTSNRLVDFAREELDLSVRYGPGGWDDVVATELVPGELIPVCSPELFVKRGDLELKSFMNGSRRIQVFSNNEWRAWGEKIGIDIIEHAPSPFIIEDFVVAISAARSGQGLALIPELIARKHIKNGSLVAFCRDRLDWEQTYYITHAPNADNQPIVRDVINWLREQAKKPD
ncbi:MAG: LysR family transcriptional regulator [Acidimicrobiales bacterium]|nr:LysR family transcriptional regulator [Hyphomonadaceae bacterium]RZV43020.1 MAG: LysR family transcriptional regulator [Acidimicrobiales bacterium]